MWAEGEATWGLKLLWGRRWVEIKLGDARLLGPKVVSCGPRLDMVVPFQSAPSHPVNISISIGP